MEEDKGGEVAKSQMMAQNLDFIISRKGCYQSDMI